MIGGVGLHRQTGRADADNEVTLAVVEGDPTLDMINAATAFAIAVIYINDRHILDPILRDREVRNFILDNLLAATADKIGGGDRRKGEGGKTGDGQQIEETSHGYTPDKLFL